MDYYKYHGANVPPKEYEILKKAKFEGYRIIKYEKLSNGKFSSTIFNAGFTFTYNKKLYMFLTYSHCSQIRSFFELNTEKNKCIHGKYGVYYEVVKIIKE